MPVKQRRNSIDHFLCVDALRFELLHNIQKLIVDVRLKCKLVFHSIEIAERVLNFQSLKNERLSSGSATLRLTDDEVVVVPIALPFVPVGTLEIRLTEIGVDKVRLEKHKESFFSSFLLDLQRLTSTHWEQSSGRSLCVDP